MSLVDLHCHMLPNVDDGASDMATAIKLARTAEEQGISHLLLTPHHMDRQFTNGKDSVMEKTDKFQACINQAGIALKVYPGQEVHLTGELIQAVDNDEIIFMDPANRYLLLELPHDDIPVYTSNIIFELISKGIVPVIAHPERNQAIQADPEKIYQLVSQGCLTQLTCSSYLGTFGKEIQTLSEQMLQANLATVFASDAHNFSSRKFLMKEAFEKLQRKNQSQAQTLQENAKNILNGEAISPLEIDHIKRKKKFWLF